MESLDLSVQRNTGSGAQKAVTLKAASMECWGNKVGTLARGPRFHGERRNQV